MYYYSFEDEHHLKLHLVKSVPPVSWYFEVQQEVILKIKTILMTLRTYSVTCGVSFEVFCSKYFWSKYFCGVSLEVSCSTYFCLKYPCQTYFYLKYPRSKYPCKKNPCSKYFCSKHSCSKYLSSKYPCSKYPCSKTFMFKISLLKMSQQQVPRGGIFVVVFFKHYKMALWPISKTYEVNYAYLQ